MFTSIVFRRSFPPKDTNGIERDSSFMLTRKQVDLAAKPRYTDPTQRLWRFCVDCTENLPKWTRAGRCVCNKSNIRSMCMTCKEKEQDWLLSKGFEVWFRKRKVRPQVELSAREKGEAMEPPKYFCKGVDKAGWLCENEVGPLGGLPTDSKAEKLKGGRMVNVCTWCGLIAVDVPNGPPNFGPCPGKATGIFK